jgi:hypothetical protein
MDSIDLMSDTLEELDMIDLRRNADRILFLHEFAVAYQEPVRIDPGRGYLTAWVTLDHTEKSDPVYQREQGRSGDDAEIRRLMGEMATEGTPKIESFIP